MLRKFESDGARKALLRLAVAPVVFLHPTPLDHDYWGPLIENLGGIRAIVPDLRGHVLQNSEPDCPSEPSAVFPMPGADHGAVATDVINLLIISALRKRPSPAAPSAATSLLEVWRRIPERMQGLIFVCSKPQPDTPAGLDKRAATIEQIRARGTAELFDGMSQSLVGTQRVNATRRSSPKCAAA